MKQRMTMYINGQGLTKWIKVGDQEFKAVKQNGLWHCRAKDALYILPIKELRSALEKDFSQPKLN